MSFLTKLFNRTPDAPLPTLEALAAERGFGLDLPGLTALIPDFEHQGPTGRATWADAVQTCVEKGWGLPEPWEDIADTALPELVPQWMAQRDGLKAWPVAEGLSKRVRIGDRSMPEAWATLWGISPDDILERALDHLKEASKTPFERMPSGIYRSPYQDGADAARLLLPHLWEGFFPGQNVFIAVPSRNEFYIAPQVLLTKLAEAVDKSLSASSAADRLVVTLYQRVEGKFVPANLQDPHPIAQPQRQLRQTDFVLALDAQKEDLAKLGGRPAPVGILPHPTTGRTFTVATWKADMACFLPESDLVALQDAAGAPLGIFVRQTFPRVPGMRGEDVDIWGPRRLRYDVFPTTEQLGMFDQFADAEQMAALMRGENPTKGKAAPAKGAPAPSTPGQGQGQASAPARPAHLKDVQLGSQGE
ncbi:MAG: hypothetical protein IPL96_12440 [Holophagaceae bacterium]|nr:hypothetical protein [Holophagaceae bacterium]